MYVCVNACVRACVRVCVCMMMNRDMHSIRNRSLLGSHTAAELNFWEVNALEHVLSKVMQSYYVESTFENAGRRTSFPIVVHADP